MLSTNKHTRFPRAAYVRRLTQLSEAFAAYREDFEREIYREPNKARKDLLEERVDVLEELHREVDAMLRTLWFWR